nr:MAG TPA: hypothetical protein [Caudoviricetes sp.]DAT89699.1 MAG TPA: hypothetical protein [Caudoviricetes sp.]
MANTNYNILVGVEFAKGEVQKQLDNLSKNLDPLNLKVTLDGADKAADGMDKVKNSTKKAKDATDDLKKSTDYYKDSALSLAVANDVWSKTVDIIGSLVEQVKSLDDSLTEYKKVSDLSGEALDDYVSKLSEMGLQVGRTGKLNQSEPVCTDGKCA